MFLIRRLLVQSRDERGSALVAVIGVMAVASLVTMTMSGLSVGALSYSNSTRAGVQAQTAAESGIDVTVASLAGSAACQPNFSSSVVPVYSVDVFFSRSSTADTWYAGCPTAADADRIRLVSTGSAGQVSVKVEAIYGYTPSPPASSAITASGAAMYSYSAGSFSISHLTLSQGTTRRATIQIHSGSGSCQAGTTITGDVILGAGAIQVTNGCTIDGSLWMTGAGTLNSTGHVTGDVYSAGVASGYSLTLDSSTAKVDGSVYAAGPVLNRGKIGHGVIAGPTAGISNFYSGSSVGGSVVLAGTANVATGTVTGTVQTNKSGIVIPAIPTVPPWVDFSYQPATWVTDAGVPYSVTTLTSSSGDCNLNGSGSTGAAKLAAAAALGTPVIFDARACGVVTIYNQNLRLKNDLVIVTNGFSLGATTFNSATTDSRKAWLIIPDETADAAPTCASRSAAITNSVTVGSTVSAMIYSPCTITNSGNQWRGQMYASSVVSNSNFNFTYLPLGLPGVNLDTGQPITSVAPGSGTLGSRLSIRNLNVG